MVSPQAEGIAKARQPRSQNHLFPRSSDHWLVCFLSCIRFHFQPGFADFQHLPA